MKNRIYLILLIVGCILFYGCAKKADKLLLLDDGLWLCDMTTVIVYNEAYKPNFITNSYRKYKFFNNGTGTSSQKHYTESFTWEIRGKELQISSLGIVPFTLKSKSKDKMVWEMIYKSSGDIKTYTYTMELLKL